MGRRKKGSYVTDDVGTRRVLREAISSNMNGNRIREALKLYKKEREDEVEAIVKDAVRATPVLSLSGIPHVFDPAEGIYVDFDFHEFELAIYDAMRNANIPNGCYGNIVKIVKLCWAECQSRKYCVDNSVFVLNNGVFDTMDGQIHEFDPKYVTNMKVDYDYNPYDSPLRWKRFLNEVLPDIEMQNLLQEFVAATLLDRKTVKFEYIMILLGHGSNGKSVVFEVFQSLFGEDNISNFSVRDLISSGRTEQNIAMCNGKRLNYCSEIRTTEIGDRNADAFKSIVSGEAQMARSLYREPFRATDIPLIMANANKLPKLSDASYALQRRILIIPFDVFIPDEKQDRELATTLKNELPGIFNWMIDGLSRLRSNNYQLSIPEKVRMMVKDYIQDNNSLHLWLDDSRIFAQWNQNANPVAQWRHINTMYRDYDTWCYKNRYGKILKKDFFDAMKALGFQTTRHADGNGFVFYNCPTEDEIRAANMDIAISMQSQQYINSLRAAAVEHGKVTVEGVEDLERYLGLPTDCVWPYIKSGQLDGTFYSSSGRMMFDVQKVQSSLALAGFYTDLQSDTGGCKRKAAGVLKGIRQSFNSKMRKLGIPIRKYGNVYGYMPMAESGCFIVPDDWEYSKRAAEIVLAQRKENLEIINQNIK